LGRGSPTRGWRSQLSGYTAEGASTREQSPGDGLSVRDSLATVREAGSVNPASLGAYSPGKRRREAAAVFVLDSVGGLYPGRDSRNHPGSLGIVGSSGEIEVLERLSAGFLNDWEFVYCISLYRIWGSFRTT